MKCTHCNCELPDDSLFCANCGKPIAPPVPAQPAPQAPVPAAEPVAAAVPAQKPHKSKKWLLWGGIGLGIVVIALIILLLTGVLGGKDYPQDGVENLLEKGNFTAEVNAAGEKYTFQVDIDWKREELTVYAEADGEFAFAIYDGYYIESSYSNGYYAYYVGNQIDVFFEDYDPDEEIDWEEVLSLVALFLTPQADVDDYVDTDQLARCMDTLTRKLQDKKWLEKNAGYTREKEDGVTLHIYEPDLYDLACALLDMFAPCIEDEDLYDYAQEALDEYEDTLSMVKIKLELGMKDHYLVSAEAKIAGVKFKAAIEDIGKTRIDIDELEEMLDNSKLYN